jgi:hypothetical protein
MWVYGFRVSNEVNVEEAMIEVKTYLVTGVFLNPGYCQLFKRGNLPEGVLASIAVVSQKVQRNRRIS